MKGLLLIILLLTATLSVCANDTTQTHLSGGFLEDHWAYIVAIVIIWILYFRITKRQDKNKKS